jgi:hypothetical protein
VLLELLPKKILQRRPRASVNTAGSHRCGAGGITKGLKTHQLREVTGQAGHAKENATGAFDTCLFKL